MCGLLVAGFFLWPHVKEFEQSTWNVHYSECESRYKRNEELLATRICDKGPNELAHQDKVHCKRARYENAWGIYMCALGSRYDKHTVTEWARHLWGSWYVTAFALVAAYLMIRYGWEHRTSVTKHSIDARVHQEAYMAMLEHATRQQRQAYLPHVAGGGYLQNAQFTDGGNSAFSGEGRARQFTDRVVHY